MSEMSAEWGPGQTLDYKGFPIRIAPIDGVPWFALPDIVEALGYRPEAANVVNRVSFPTFAQTTAEELPDDEVPGEPERVTVLSPIGVWLLTHFTNPERGQGIAAWAKREAVARCTSAAPDNRHMFLQLLPGDQMPPYPLKYSGRKAEWVALRECYPCSRSWRD